MLARRTGWVLAGLLLGSVFLLLAQRTLAVPDEFPTIQYEVCVVRWPREEGVY